MPDLWTPAQAAAYLQMSISAIRSYVRQGKLRAYRLAGLRQLRFYRRDIKALLVQIGPMANG